MSIKKSYSIVLICTLFLLSLSVSASEGVPPSDVVEEALIDTEEILDCPIDIFGTWEVVDFMPNAFQIMGILQSYKYQSMALDALNKKIEFQPEFYRFEDSIFKDIEYQIQIVSSDCFSQAEFQYLLSLINQTDYSDTGFEQNIESAEATVTNDKLFVIFAKGVEDSIWSGEHSEEELLATTTTEFVLIGDDYIYHIMSGLLCKRVS